MSYSSSIKSTACLGRPALLGSDLSVVLNVDMVVGREGVDLVFRELGTVVCQLMCMQSQEGSCRRDIREALDQLELGGNLAALLGDLLLGAAMVNIGRLNLYVGTLTSRAGRHRHLP